MSADFWAGYISGAVGILIGNPLDLVKVRLQAASPLLTASDASSISPIAAGAGPRGTTPATPPRAISLLRGFTSASSLATGAAGPALGYGALNALLFVSYHRAEAALNGAFSIPPSSGANLWTTWLAGAAGGLATWVVSTPTELIKCRAQLATAGSSPASSAVVAAAAGTSSWAIARDTFRAEGVRGLYFGGAVTALRDSVGYGFYFWSYELGTRWMADLGAGSETAKVLLCGGVAGIVTWASIFPLDVIKTRVQAQVLGAPRQGPAETAALLSPSTATPESNVDKRRLGAWEIAKEAYREGGARVFFRGLVVCSVRAFIVNAVQWAVYEMIMTELGAGRNSARKSEVTG